MVKKSYTESRDKHNAAARTRPARRRYFSSLLRRVVASQQKLDWTPPNPLMLRALDRS